jgi:protease IV
MQVMNNFFKMMFASMLGTFLTLLILTFITIIVVVAVISVSLTSEVTTPKHAMLQVTLDRPIFERSPRMPFFLDGNQRMGLNDILKNIKKAKDDPAIQGIYLDLSYVPAGVATLEEIRDALLDFKKSGKPVVTYSEFLTQGAYYLASVSDRICIQPQGTLIFKGLNAELLFIKGTLDKLDIKMQVVRHGKFKAATEPLFLDKMSPENRLQVTELVNREWEKILEGISASRNIPVSRLNEMADSLNSQIPADALKCRLIDQVAYKDEFVSGLKKMLNLPEKKDISMISLEKYSGVPEKTQRKTVKSDKIAIIYAAGNIVEGEGNEQSVGSDRFAKAIKKAREDSRVKAIVLRVNSPGGSALASDVIWREVMLTVKEKPVVASFGDVAASGGYYIACPASKIIAEPTTVTGSIGVFGVIPNFKDFFNKKLGITFDNVASNKNSDFIPVNSPMSAYQTQAMQKSIESVYSSFVKKVSEGRHLPEAKVDSIGQGRVWNAMDAKNIGLVDDLGGIDKAITVAAQLAGIKDYRISALPEQKDPFQEFIDQMTGSSDLTKTLEKSLGEDYRYIRYLMEVREMKGVQARMPFDIVIN